MNKWFHIKISKDNFLIEFFDFMLAVSIKKGLFSFLEIFYFGKSRSLSFFRLLKIKYTKGYDIWIKLPFYRMFILIKRRI